MKNGIKKILVLVRDMICRPKIFVEVVSVSNKDLFLGKSYIITGGNRGIGLSIAKRLRMHGANVVIVGRNEKELVKVSDELQCKYLVCDLTDIPTCKSIIDNAEELVGEVDGIVLNAGCSLHEKNILDVTIENYDKQLDTNLKANYFLAQSYISHVMKDERDIGSKEKNILFVSSERGDQCDDVPYGLTKNSINTLVKGLSRRWYKYGIRVNAVSPGITATAMTGVKSGGDMYASTLSSERYFVPEEVAEVTAFLLSPSAKCISGEIIRCDAGNYISSYY